MGRMDVYGQKENVPSFYLNIVKIDSSNASSPAIQRDFSTLNDLNKYADNLLQLLINQGFVTASIDSSVTIKDTLNIWLFLGQKYKWQQIKVQARDSLLLLQLGLTEKEFSNLTNDKAVEQISDKVLDYYSTTGYPFAAFSIDSIQIIDTHLYGVMKINKGGYYQLDAIINEGNAKLTPNFLHRYLEIEPHSAYNVDKLSTLSSKLNNLAYVQESQPWKVKMTNTGAILNLYLESKKVNQVDAIVGFLPANGSAGGKLLLTGQVNLDLKNSFAAGEEIKFSWQQLQSQSPRLNLGFKRPYIFNSPYGIDFDFELYKKDSSYMNTFANLGVQYAISSQQTGSVFVQFSSSRLLNVDTTTILLTKELPTIRDISSTSIGFQYYINNTNYRLNPRRGNEFSISVMAGNRKEGRNSTIDQLKSDTFDYSHLYDTVKLNSYQYKVKFAGSHYFPIGKQAVLKSTLSGGLFQAPNAYVNELFQIGGYRLLRGFDEESIFANKYAVASAEYRYLIGQNAYFFGFADGGWTNYNVTGTKIDHTYLGLGVGMAFQTKAGILNLNYAVGKTDETKFDMQKAKIHIGFVSVF